MTLKTIEIIIKKQILREDYMDINISSLPQDFPVAEIRYEANHQQPLQTHTIAYFDAHSGKTKNFEISGGEWINYFGTGWYIFGKGSSLEIKTEINKNPQDNYELDFTGTGWYSNDFTLEVMVNGTDVGTISYPLTGPFKNEAKFDITRYINNGTNTITLKLSHNEFILNTFKISNK
ncbi:MAG: hypothetical protein K1X28_09910 [Parachlamydiales bacterium]|nr:hypothetical protein [Parachlamydiales bacterium]